MGVGNTGQYTRAAQAQRDAIVGQCNITNGQIFSGRIGKGQVKVGVIVVHRVYSEFRRGNAEVKDLAAALIGDLHSIARGRHVDRIQSAVTNIVVHVRGVIVGCTRISSDTCDQCADVSLERVAGTTNAGPGNKLRCVGLDDGLTAAGAR